MKVEKIVCNRCGKEIIGDLIRIFPEVVDRESDVILVGTIKDNWDREMMNYDYCDECIEKIMRFAKGEPVGLESDVVVIQMKELTEEEIAGIRKAMEDMPPNVIMIEPPKPNVEMVIVEPEPEPESEPESEPEPEPTETNENQQEITISNPQKLTVKELILQGMSKDEVMKLTGCKKTTYNQTKCLLKKQGLLPEDEQKTESTQAAEGNVKTYKCSEVGSKCTYMTTCGSQKICNYIEIEGHRRGCKPEECDKFRKK